MSGIAQRLVYVAERAALLPTILLVVPAFPLLFTVWVVTGINLSSRIVDWAFKVLDRDN